MPQNAPKVSSSPFGHCAKANEVLRVHGAMLREQAGMGDINPLDIPADQLATPHMARTKTEDWLISKGVALDDYVNEIAGDYEEPDEYGF